MSHGRIVGTCRDCHAKTVREAHVHVQDIKDPLGPRRIYIHTAIKRQHQRDEGRPCLGAVIPRNDYLHPPPQPMTLDAYKERPRGDT